MDSRGRGHEFTHTRFDVSVGVLRTRLLWTSSGQYLSAEMKDWPPVVPVHSVADRAGDWGWMEG